jgi:hypothetical protein
MIPIIMTSIYIPLINVNFGEEKIQKIFEEHQIGLVSRVDFVAIEGNSRMKKAFVHLSKCYDTQLSFEIKLKFDEDLAFRLYPDMDSRVYWILLKNKCPIPETTLNVHQLAENHRILEELVMKQIDELRESRDLQAEQIDRLQQSVWQLLGYADMSDVQPAVFDNDAVAKKDREYREEFEIDIMMKGHEYRFDGAQYGEYLLSNSEKKLENRLKKINNHSNEEDEEM